MTQTTAIKATQLVQTLIDGATGKEVISNAQRDSALLNLLNLLKNEESEPLVVCRQRIQACYNSVRGFMPAGSVSYTAELKATIDLLSGLTLQNLQGCGEAAK